MKFNRKALPLTSKALFTIVGGAVLINPVYAQDQDQQGEEIDTVVVTGLRGSLKASMETKRDALGVVDAINAEDIGKFPDTNLAESLQRITGVSIDRRNGEGSQVTARGFGPQFNLVTLNGRQIPGSDGFSNGDITTGGNGAGTRSFNFANLAAEAISEVQVYKTGRAEIPTGGIGAAINIKTARPFDNDGTVANFGVKGVYDNSAPFSSDVTPEVSGIFSYANDDKTWGVGLTASYQERHGGSVQSTVNAWNISRWNGTSAALRPGAVVTNAPDEGQLYGLPNDIRYAFSDFQRERLNAQATLQFAPSDAVTFTVDYTFAQNEIEEDRGEQTMWLQRSNSFTHLEFDTDETIATPTFLRDVVGGKDFGFEQQHNMQKSELNSIGFNAEWKVTDSFGLTLDVHNSESESTPNDPVTGGSATFVSLAGTNCPLGVCTGAWAQEFQFNNGLPIAGRTFFNSTADAVANVNGTVNPNFDEGHLGSQMLRVWGTEQSAEVQQARLDGKLEFEQGRFNFGVDFRTVEMTRKTGYGEAVLGDWSASDAGGNAGMVDLLRPFNMTSLFNDFGTAGAAGGAWRGNATQLAEWGLSATHPVTGRVYNWNPANTTTPAGVLSADPALDNDNRISEDVQAAYIQFAIKGELGDMPTNTLLGVRYEKTEVESVSSIFVPTAILWTANNDFTLARSTDLAPFAEKAEYSHVLPSLDFDIGLTDTVKGRLSYSKTIARANYGNLYAGPNPGTPSGSILISETTRAAGNAQNPALAPLESDNLDLSLEWYFSDSGFVSAGWWEKRVDNFIGTAVSRESLYDIRDATSGPDAQAALAFLLSGACQTQVTNAGEDVAAACSANDTALFTAVAMLRNADDTGGLAAYDGSSAQILDMENAYNLEGEADDPFYSFAVQRPVNQEAARIRGYEVGGQYFFGETGFGVLANYTFVSGDVNFDDNAAPGTQQFALLGLSDTANLVLMYEKFGFTARLAYNWRDKFLAATNQNGSNTNPFYVDAYDQIDLSVGYDFSEKLAFNFEAINLTGEDIRWFGRSEKQLVRLEDASARYAVGVRYKF